jgi:hypothetical protein
MDSERKRWLDEPKNVDRVFYAVCALCALVALLDVGGWIYHKEAHYPAERLWNFHGFYGFVACWVLVLAAKQLRKLVMRKEDFYD